MSAFLSTALSVILLSLLANGSPILAPKGDTNPEILMTTVCAINSSLLS